MSSKANKFQAARNTAGQAADQAALLKMAEECRNEVLQVLERRGYKMVVAQQTLDGQIVPLANIPLMIVFAPKQIASVASVKESKE